MATCCTNVERFHLHWERPTNCDWLSYDPPSERSAQIMRRQQVNVKHHFSAPFLSTISRFQLRCIEEIHHRSALDTRVAAQKARCLGLWRRPRPRQIEMFSHCF